MSTTTSLSRTALITGGSSGIGLELARLFAAERYDLVLVARSRARLQEVGAELQNAYGVNVRIAPKDLSHAKACEELFEELREAGIRVHTLVNNAGFGSHGEFADSDLQQDLDMLQVNVVALTELTKLFLPQIKTASGAILNVASTAAFQPGPLMAIYYATKAYVLSFTEAIAEELADSGVTVSVLCPGPVFTRFQERANLGNTSLMKSPAVLDAKTVAITAMEGLKKGKRVIIPGKLNLLVVEALRISPRNAVTKVAKKLNQKK